MSEHGFEGRPDVRCPSGYTRAVIPRDLWLRLYNLDGVCDWTLERRDTGTRSDGKLCELIAVPGGGSRTPPSEKVVAERMQYIKMKGHETFKVAVRTLEEIARTTLEANQLRVEDVDLYVPHQANVRILSAVMERLGMTVRRNRFDEPTWFQVVGVYEYGEVRSDGS